MDIKKIKDELAELVPEAIHALRSVMKQESAAPQARVRACELLFDRIGVPAIKALVTKQIGPGEFPWAPVEDPRLLIAKSAKNDREIEELRTQLNGVGVDADSNSVHVEG
jgi:hypothetical protein